MPRFLLMSAALSVLASCSAKTAPPAPPLPTAVAPTQAPVVFDPASLGPAEGSTCDFEHDGKPEAPLGLPPDEGPAMTVVDRGQEPRMAVRSGSVDQLPESWTLTTENTVDLGAFLEKTPMKIPVFRYVELTKLAVEALPNQPRLRVTVESSDEGGVEFDTPPSEEVERAARENIGTNNIPRGTFFEVALERGRPSAVTSDGGRGTELVGKFTPLMVPVPDEPLGVGAHWTLHARTHGITVDFDVRIESIRDNVATLDAAFTIVTGPYRIRDTEDTKELWETWIYDQHQARLVIDPSTPVVGFQDERTSEGIRAACEQGRVAILRMKSPSSLRFARNR